MAGNLELGKFLRELRQGQGRLISDVAREIKTSVAFLSDIERGTRGVTPARLEVLLTALGVPRKENSYVKAYQLLGKLPEHVEVKVLKKPEAW